MTTRESQRERARILVMRHGWNVVSYQILHPGISLWFSPTCEAVVGYVLRHGVRVVAGAPVCAARDLAAVVAEFEAHAKTRGQDVCYFGAAGRLRDLLGDNPNYSIVVLGAQPAWHPRSWRAIFQSDKTLRAQLNRAKNKGVCVEEWPLQKAQGNASLKKILAQWLRTRGLPSLHFLVESQTLDCLGDRRIFVAQKNGEPVGFVVLCPVVGQNGFLTEQFVRGKNAPNGTIELALFTAIEAVAREGASYVTMGLVPLSFVGVPEGANPLWLRLVLGHTRAHGRRFYNFAGLEAFKTKFYPEKWEPIYAIANAPQFLPRFLWAIAAAFTRRPVWVSLLLGVRRAIRQEARWLWQNSGPERG